MKYQLSEIAGLHQIQCMHADFVLASILVMFTFILGLFWGYITQKSDNIWGSVLAHMIADAFAILAVFGAI